MLVLALTICPLVQVTFLVIFWTKIELPRRLFHVSYFNYLRFTNKNASIFNHFVHLGGNQRDLARAKNQKKLTDQKKSARSDNLTVEQRKAR